MSRFRPVRLAPLLAALCLLTASADAGENPTKYYRDANFKFSFRIFPEWNQVPVEIGEEIEVAKFVQASSQGRLTPEIHVVRVVKDPEKAGPAITGGEGPGAADPMERFRESRRPKTAWDAAFGRLFDSLGVPPDKRPKPDGAKEIESKDKVPGRLWKTQVPWGWGSRGGQAQYVYAALACFEKDGVEYGILFQSSKQDEKKYAKGFEAVAKSFRFFDAKAEEVESLDVLDGVNITPKRRREIERGQIKGWAVLVSPKKQYVVIYNTANNKNHALAKTIAERIEKIREQLYEVQFPPAKPIEAVSIVRVCKDAKDYHEYGGPGGSAGYWNSGSQELVFYDMSRAQKIDDDTVGVLYHEAFHQFIFYSVGNVAPHSWFNEGHGDYYAGAKYKNGKFTIGPFPWRVGVVKNAIVQGPRPFTLVTPPVPPGAKGPSKPVKQWGSKGYTPIRDLVRFSQGEYYSYAGVSYAQGWSLIYFLREIVPKNKKYAEKWGKILPTYFDTLKGAVNGLVPMGGFVPDDGDDGGEDDPDGKDDDGGTPQPPTTPDGGEPTPPGPKGGGEPPTPPGPGGGDEPEPPQEPAIPMTYFRGLGDDSALEKAVSEAFKGVDWDEFEAAWLKETK